MIESPCNKVCLLDPRSGWCLGCGRSGAEIAAWTRLSPEARRAIMALLPARLEGLAA
ncbi:MULTISPECIES: DUF1289 domain-containing protein [Roseomonadaceae]|uniref:DUF1289 domain-containing protein n=1 Tax=Falsiroseomonas oleicola TaxID=2801474 RepID=A0ABS6H9L5_9PROT|nr:DUF1289 domain-containing protein [Roseomonas oleicola]MBU8545390.1 DUF1289 domain-containing protein [Roseomonas oleicola]